MACTSPNVTRLAVPIVRITKPQKMAACMKPGSGSRNMRIWTMAYRIDEPRRRSGWSVTADGWAAANTRRWRAIWSVKPSAASTKKNGAKG